MPLPEPEAPLEMVTHPALLTAVQAQPAPVVTLTLPVLAEEPADVPMGASVRAQGLVKANWFETVLRLTPPGPTAATRAS